MPEKNTSSASINKSAIIYEKTIGAMDYFDIDVNLAWAKPVINGWTSVFQVRWQM